MISHDDMHRAADVVADRMGASLDDAAVPLEPYFRAVGVDVEGVTCVSQVVAAGIDPNADREEVIGRAADVLIGIAIGLEAQRERMLEAARRVGS